MSVLIQKTIAATAPHALQGVRSIGKLGVRAISHLGKTPNSEPIYPEGLKKLEQTSREIQKLTDLLKKAALSVDRYDRRGIERTIAKSEGIVKNLHVLTLTTLEDQFATAERFMIDRKLYDAMDGFKRVIDFGKQLGSDDHTVNRLVAKAYYLTAVSKIAMNGREDEVVELLKKSVELVPELKESVSLLRDIENSHWGLHKSLLIAQYGPESY